MFFRKTKADILQKAAEVKESFDHIVDELVTTRSEMMVTTNNAVAHFDYQVTKAIKAATIFITCYLILLFGMLGLLLFFVI